MLISLFHIFLAEAGMSDLAALCLSCFIYKMVTKAGAGGYIAYRVDIRIKINEAIYTMLLA